MKQTLSQSNAWQKRIGAIGEDGARAWPEETISGRAYARPAHTLDLNASAFVVYDVFRSESDAALIEALRAAVEQHVEDKPQTDERA